MRLINASTGQLEYFFEDVPKYAILSHTWEDEEVTFQEFSKLSAKTKKGYLKIERSCRIALLHGLQYAWVDTCCIDKTSSAELTESINSMFPWYQRAEKCYAFLSDLRPGALAEEKLAACRWFTRGWTLQELIAPKEVRFYDQEWNFIGTKMDFSDKISSITGIDMNILQGTSEPNERSIATRMSWAAHRQTSRIEDLAYCLLGIFDVNMPLIYGEGWKAFRRLQEEIVRHSNDLTIFAWDHEKEQEQDAQWGLFSPSPSGFAKSAFVQRYNRQTVDPEFSITNKGLRFD
ncbi:HET-domain-containing protein, partial [Acephala macrosclerotiorum]